MLPKNRLGRRLATKLKVYAGPGPSAPGAEAPSARLKDRRGRDDGRHRTVLGNRASARRSVARVLPAPGPGRDHRQRPPGRRVLRPRDLAHDHPPAVRGHVDRRASTAPTSTSYGGGVSAQAVAIRHGITRALLQVDPEHRPRSRRPASSRATRARSSARSTAATRRASARSTRKRPELTADAQRPAAARPDDRMRVPVVAYTRRHDGGAREPALSRRVPVAVLGATGYAGVELLRLLAPAPRRRDRVPLLRAVPRQPRRRRSIPFLAGRRRSAARGARRRWRQSRAELVFSALPHGASAPLVRDVLADGRRGARHLGRLPPARSGGLRALVRRARRARAPGRGGLRAARAVSRRAAAAPGWSRCRAAIRPARSSGWCRSRAPGSPRAGRRSTPSRAPPGRAAAPRWSSSSPR